MSTKDGGPAFPALTEQCGISIDGKPLIQEMSSGGMSLRDYFAAAALTGFCASRVCHEDWEHYRFIGKAYEFADAMLAEREREATE